MSRSVSQILSILSLAAEKPDKSKEALNVLFEPLGYDVQELKSDEKPSDEDARKVIDAMAALVQVQKSNKKGLFEKNPGLADKRLQALRIIREWLDKKRPEYSPAFDNLHLNRLGIQLGLRVLRPRAINQANYGFCGPVTILYPLNKTEPVKYVEYVLGLADVGSGRLGNMEINVKECAVVLRSYQNNQIPEVDYVSLASLRTAVDIAVPMHAFNVGDPADTHSHATAPEQMTKALEWAGYYPVVDCTLKDYQGKRDSDGLITAYDRLDACAQLLRSQPGFAIITLVHGILAKAAKRGAPIKGPTENLKLGDLHWNVVKNMVLEGCSRSDPLTGTVTMKVVTWRWAGITAYKMEDFLPRFFGYIAGDPSATASKQSSKEIVV